MPRPRRTETAAEEMIHVRMTSTEVARLDDLRGDVPRSVYIRRLIERDASAPPFGEPLDEPQDLGPLADEEPVSGPARPPVATPRARAVVVALLDVAADREALLVELRDAVDEELQGRRSPS